MANINTSADIQYAIDEWYGPNLLDVAVPKLISAQFGQKKSIPKNSSKTVVWRRFEEFDEATTALTEGVQPDGQDVNVTKMTATAQQYGDLCIVTDVDILTIDDPVMNQVNKRLGEQMARSYDTLTFDILDACGSLYDCQYGGNLNTPTEVSQQDMDSIIQTLMDQDASMFTNIVSASTGVGTAPLDESYYVMGNTALYRDLKNLDSWVPINQYPKASDLKAGERGYTDNARWCLSSKAPVDTSGANDIYSFFVVGQDAYGIVDIEGGNMESIYTEPGGHGDRLKQLSSLGWKGWHTGKILNDLYMVKGRCTLAY